MIRYTEPLIRPPSEAESLILQVTHGCSYNQCAFCFTYTDKPFRARPEDEVLREIDWAGENLAWARRVFLADGDALVLSTDRLLRILDRIARKVPQARRVSAYATPHNFKHKTVAELEKLRAAGLTQLYVGFESGDDEVLERIGKGVDQDQMVALCSKAHEAGIKISGTLVLGLGGPRLSQRHAEQSARLLDRIQPRFASALTLMLEPGSDGYSQQYGDPDWRLLEPEEMLKELRTLVAGVEANGIIFRSNHASNYLALAGTFQKGKANMLAQLDEALEGMRELRPEFLRGL